MRKAQGYEAIVQTLEKVLSCFDHTGDTDDFVTDEEFELPDPPDFEI